MNRSAATAFSVSVAAILATTLALPGCISIHDSSGSSSYRGVGATTKAQVNAMVAANTQNRIGETSDVVLGRFPADHVSLFHSSKTESGTNLAVYRVYARDKYNSTRFERYLVFENDQLVMLTENEDNVGAQFGPGIMID